MTIEEIENIDLEEVDNIEEYLEVENINMAQNHMDLFKYLPKFEGKGKDKDSTVEHVRAFKEYLAIHNNPKVVGGDVAPQWKLIHTCISYSLAGIAKKLVWRSKES